MLPPAFQYISLDALASRRWLQLRRVESDRLKLKNESISFPLSKKKEDKKKAKNSTEDDRKILC